MIRPANPNDLDFVYDLYMHPQVNPYLLYEPMDKTAFAPIFHDLITSGIKYIYHDSTEDAGMFKLIPLAHRTSHIAYLGGLAIHPSHGGKGYGLRMLNEIIEFAKSRSFLRVELSVATVNTKAIRLYEKAGFEKEGIYRKYTFLKSENRFLDEVVMSVVF